MNDDELLPIGRFARLVRLSVKRLRHYADLGLLPPARIDPDTGYRYYRAAQARDAMSIGLLRSLDVPLAAVGEVLSGPDPAGALARVRDELDAELARRRLALSALERIAAEGLPGAEVSVVREPPRRVAVVREPAESERDIGRVAAACAGRLAAALAGRLGPAPLTGLFPLDLDEPIPVAVAAELPEGAAAPPGLAAERLAGGVFASAVHTGPYDQVPLTLHAVLAWCGERGHAPAGPVREVYLSDPAAVPPERLATRLLVPLDGGFEAP
ncbi:MerR family transcriptional regulator [Allonocardiopsis opalescens]|uniref:Effector-binding domain-containing protein n=1 Tax=Allonocardiopsis opalescens TaxID=1144618 RepID=A0A2T0Q9I7_9ACTN|nr:MerR family transcriptional regulator [Allonocardiopsis opalescens]PRY00524.1 effector-binding domain-containing protein [Allonocardiopsis opalescens]